MILFVTVSFSSFSKNIKGGVYYSEKKKISYFYENSDYLFDWFISPDQKPDILRVYCDKSTNLFFNISTEKIKFKISEKDTIDFVIILNGKDSAFTQIIGVKELPNTISNEEKLFYLSLLWSEVKYNFVNFDRIDFDWDTLYKRSIIEILKTKNDDEYFRILQKFYAKLKDGHTQIQRPSSLRVYYDYIPINIDVFEKQLYITSIRKGNELDSTFLHAKILKIDNIPIDEYLKNNIFPFISASTEQSKWFQVPQTICYDLKSKKFVAEVLKTNGESAIISLKRDGEVTRSMNDRYFNINTKENENWDLVQLDWLTDSILHLSINSFYPEEIVISQLNSKENEILRAKKLIIDLRNNGGGVTNVAWILQSYLTKDKYFINYAWQSRINDGVKKANGNWIEEYADYYTYTAYRTENGDTIFISDTIKRWEMPVVILIGEFTFSAAEDFLVNMYEVPDRPILIGSETGGSTGSPLVIENLPLNSWARLCTRRILYPYSKTPFVNKGITPDIIVNKTFQNYCTGEDVVLEKALEILKK
jgi:carboxyl-terminal processing protease